MGILLKFYESFNLQLFYSLFSDLKQMKMDFSRIEGKLFERNRDKLTFQGI
jgi:hypothetical protein